MGAKGSKRWRKLLVGGVATFTVLALGMSLNAVQAKPPKSGGQKQATHVSSEPYDGGIECSPMTPGLCRNGGPPRIYATLRGPEPLPGKTLEFWLTDRFGERRLLCTEVTDKYGQARCTVHGLTLLYPVFPGFDLLPWGGTYEVWFRGDSQYQPSMHSGRVGRLV